MTVVIAEKRGEQSINCKDTNQAMQKEEDRTKRTFGQKLRELSGLHPSLKCPTHLHLKCTHVLSSRKSPSEMPSQRVIEQFCIDSMQDFHDDHDDDLIISSNPFNGAGSKVTSTQRPPQLAQAADKPALVEINDPTNPINIPPPTPSPPLDATTDNTKSFNRGWDSSSADIPSLQEKDIDWTSTAADIGDDDPIIDNHLNNSDAFSSISQLSNTSSTTVIATSPVPSLPVSPPKGWPCPSYDLSKPFPWFRLPREIRHKILGKLLVREDAIRPWFNEGSVYLSAHECGVEDIDTRVLYTGEKGKGWNRQWYEDATDVLYGGNIFELSEPRVARWWCERIGANLRKVKTVIVWLEGGCAKGESIRAFPEYCVLLVTQSPGPGPALLCPTGGSVW